MIYYIRPYTPDLTGWLTKFGREREPLRRQRPLRAHPADLQRVPVRPTRPAGPHAAPRPSQRRTASDRARAALPGRGHAAAAGRLGAVARHRRHPLQPRRRSARPMRRISRQARCSRSPSPALRVFGVGAGGERRARNYQVRAIFDDVARGAGRGREDRRREGGQDRVDRRDAGQQGGRDRCTSTRPASRPSTRRALHDPAAVADRREVRRVRPGHRHSPCCADPGRAPGAGEHHLPVANTSAPVDIDLINNIDCACPTGQRLAILLNEFGTGLAGPRPGPERADPPGNPALRETDEVLAVLAEPEPHARATWPRTPTASWRRSRQAPPAGRLHRARPTRPARRRPSEQPTSSADRALPGLPEPAPADAGGSGRARRPDDAGADRPGQGGAGTQPLHRGARPVLERGDDVARVARQDDATWRAARAQEGAAGRERPGASSPSNAEPVSENLDDAHHQPRARPAASSS